jgi:long-chain acyl-CoA synthetase
VAAVTTPKAGGTGVNLATIIDPHPPDAVALVSRRRKVTYGELRAQVARLRGGLIAGLGLEPGDRVAIVAPNNTPFVVTYLAVLGTGLVAVPLNPLAPAPELAAALRTSGARAVIVTPAAAEAVAAVDRSTLPALRHVVLAGAPAGAERSGGDVALDDLLASAPASVLDRADADLAALLFTSGTDGVSRAAMLTHANLRSNLEQLQGHLGRRQEEDDVVFGVLPFFHIFGLNVVLGLSLHTGSRIVLEERFDPHDAIEAITDHGVTIVPGAPPLWAAWAALPGVPADAFASVRLAASGAARLPVEVAETIRERFGLTVTEGYGLTEASPVVSTAGGAASPPGSVGTPLPGVEVRLVGDDGEDVLEGDAGEVWVRGPNVFAGYWEDPAATAAALAGGWLHTGDVAVADETGFLFLVDRKKDLIIVSGFNVYPAEVEEVLAGHPAVEAVAVVGVPHPHTGESVTAHVVAREGVAVDEDEVIAWCRRRLARYKCPAKVRFVAELPVGPGGKLLRRELRLA